VTRYQPVQRRPRVSWVRVPNVHALEAPLSGVVAQGLIGRNLLMRAVFVYDGRLNTYRLTF